ncbi:MAG TPA: hypothetical protein PJ988_17905 [Anaerolinea sp.]|nr:hypothetical protein [Anaerolinea sp.]
MTSMLTDYEGFLARVEDLGFMALSTILPGFPSLGGETPPHLWHTGLETDPWRWKDRAAEEKHLAYGCILGGHKGFITQRMYPIFYAAYHPESSMPERWGEGTINYTTWRLWQLFEESGMLNISQVRHTLGAGKQGAGAVDASIRQLHHEFYLTVDGNDRKISSAGKLYGWPVIRYCRVRDWAPAGWLDGAEDWPAKEARALILADGTVMAVGVKSQDLAKKLGFL